MTAPWVRTSRASRSSATTPTCGRRATSSTTRRKSVPSPCRTSGPVPTPIRSTYLVENADFVACHQFGLRAHQRPRLRARGRHPPPECSIRSGRGVGPPPAGGPAAGDRQGPHGVERRCESYRARGRPGRTHQHRHAAVLLRPLECHRPRDRRSPGQGEHREGVQASRPHGRGAQPRGGRQGPARDASRRAPHVGRLGAPHAACRRGRGSRLRSRRDGADARRRGRSPAGQRPPRGRHVPDRDRPVGEAQPGRCHPGVGRRPVHRLRQVRDRVPACRHPDEGVPGGGPRRARPRTS